MHTNRPRTVFTLVVGLLAALGASTASAQSLGTFRWQFQPFCNVVSLAVEPQGAVFLLTGFDDQCGGGAVRAAAAGSAFTNPDGSIGMALLTTAGTPGHAMKASPVLVQGVALYPGGAILGKALEPLSSDAGVIRVLVTLR